MYLSVDELLSIGFRRVGKNPKISRYCRFYHIDGAIGHNVRVDDFCIIKGRVELRDYCHIASYVMISGIHAPVIVGEFVGLAARTTVLSGTDDYAADTLGCPETPAEYTTPIKGPVTFGIASMVGAHCVVLPNVRVGDAASIGCGCIVWKDVPAGAMVRSKVTTILEKKRDVQVIKGLAVRVLENLDGEV